MIDISIILPAYNEEGNIEKSVKQALSFFKKIFKKVEIIVVNDGSRDRTGQILHALQKKIPELRVIDHKVNKGYGTTVWDGLRAGRGKLVFFTDSDLQFDIKEAKKFVAKIQDENYDVVLGYRKHRSEGFMRALNAKGWKLVAFTLLGNRNRDIDCAFKLFKRKVIQKTAVLSGGATFSAELLYRIKKAGYRVAELPVTHFKREFGSPTGAKLSVIIRSFKEIFSLFASEPDLIKPRIRIAGSLAVIGLFLSRILLMSRSADFFDATQYMWRTSDNDLLRAITTGHAPYHPLFIFFSNLIYRIPGLHDEILVATLPAVIFGSASIVVLYFLIRDLLGRKVAWLTSTIYALLPFVFFSQISILVDPVMHFFFYLSLLLMTKATKQEMVRNTIFLSIGSGISLALAALAHTQIGFWAIAFIGVYLIAVQSLKWGTLKKGLLIAILIGIFASLAVLVYIKLLLIGEKLTPLGNTDWRKALDFLLFDNIGEKDPFSITVAFNRITLLSTGLLAAISFAGAIALATKKRVWYLLGLLIWIVPAVVTATYIHENLYGRAIILALAPIAVLSSLGIIRSGKFKYPLLFLVFAQLLLITIPGGLTYHSKPAPNEVLAVMKKDSEKDGVFTATNISRTWGSYDGKFLSFGDQGVGSGDVYKESLKAIESGKKAYLSSDAIYYPFNRYDGEYFDLRSTIEKGPSDHKTMLYDVFNKLNVNIERASEFRQAIYTLGKSQSSSVYDNIAKIALQKPVVFGRVRAGSKPVSDLTVNLYSTSICRQPAQNIGRLDFVRCLGRYIAGRRTLEDWSFTDKDGWFYIPTENNNITVNLAPVSTETRSASLEGMFAEELATDVIYKNYEVFSSLDDLKKKTASLDNSFYIKTELKEGKIIYWLYEFEYNLEPTGKIEAEKMSGELNTTKNSPSASGGKVKFSSGDKAGYLISGPYSTLLPGKYKLAYQLKQVKYSGDKSVEFDVVSGDKTAGRKELKATELKANEKVEFEFELKDSLPSAEIRLRVPMGCSLELDYIDLARTGAAL